jgi:hypothetical protein
MRMATRMQAGLLTSLNLDMRVDEKVFRYRAL